MGNNIIPFEDIPSGEILAIQRLLRSKEGESLMRLLELTERATIVKLKKQKEIPLYQAQGVALFLDDLEELLKVGSK